jgi:AcrR family transcriptional regulator
LIVGRQKTIDRDKVLEAAESIVASQGAAALTIDAVAQAAGISKGGVQSCFGNKEALVDAMLKRWGALYAAQVEALAGPAPTPLAALGAHIKTTVDEDDDVNTRTAALMATLMQSPVYLAWIREWYAQRFGDLARLEGSSGSNARIAFLATEGLFLLRHFGLMDVSRQEWERYFGEIGAVFDTAVQE